MTSIIISKDPSTEFLFDIISNLQGKNILFDLIEVHPSCESYKSARARIFQIPDSSTVLFFGHGQSNQLYGGESDSYQKRVLVSQQELKLIGGQYFFVLACNSADLLRSSFRLSFALKSVGFGFLSTEMIEIESESRLLAEGIGQSDLNRFKNAIVETISEALVYMLTQDAIDFIAFKDYLCLLINIRINKAVIVDGDIRLSDLLYRMQEGIVIF